MKTLSSQNLLKNLQQSLLWVLILAELAPIGPSAFLPDSCGLWVERHSSRLLPSGARTMMCQRRFIGCSECALLLGDIGNGGGFLCGCRELSVPFLVAQRVKKPPAVQDTWVWSLGWKDSLEKGMAAHSSILAWRIPWTEEPSGSQEPATTEQLTLYTFCIILL